MNYARRSVGEVCYWYIFFSTLQIFVKLFDELHQMNEVEMNKTLVEIKKTLVVEEGGEAADNIPPHVRKFHFNNNVQ